MNDQALQLARKSNPGAVPGSWETLVIQAVLDKDGDFTRARNAALARCALSSAAVFNAILGEASPSEEERIIDEPVTPVPEAPEPEDDEEEILDDEAADALLSEDDGL